MAIAILRLRRFIFRRGQVCCRLRLFSPPGTWLMQWLLTAHCVSHLHPFTSPTPSIAVHGSCLPVNSDRYGLRVERLPPPSHYRFPRHRSCVTVSGRFHFDYSNKLSLTATLQLSPPPLLRRGVGPLPLRCQPVIAFGALLRKETSACYSEPSMMGCGTSSSIHA